MKKMVSGIVIAFAVFLGLVVAGPFFVVHQGEQAILVRFGAIVDKEDSPVRYPGLRLKLPFIDQVVRYPTRILTWDGAAQTMPTSEMQHIIVDVTARWRIADPVLFYTALTTIEAAQLRLSAIIDSAVRNVVGYNELREMVRNSNHIIERAALAAEAAAVIGDDGEIDIEATVLAVMMQTDAQNEPIIRGRRELADEMLVQARPLAINEFGIDIIDIVTRQVRYTEELTASVHNRMILERGAVAQFLRSTGQGERARILGSAERERLEIMSAAYAEAQTIMGTADAEAARIFAQAYMRHQGFFDFWRAIESYRVTLPGFNAMLSTDMEYFRFLFSPTN